MNIKYMNIIRCIFLALFTFQIHLFISQDSTTTPSFSSNISNLKNPSSEITFSGFYRFLGYVRNQQETFPNNSGKTTAIVVGDFFREPMLLLKLNGKTKDNVSFGADLMINSIYKGPAIENNRSLTLDLGLNLRTSIVTNFGVFNFSSGGVSWYRQSRLTAWGNRSFNRMSIYERRPQTPLNNNPLNRYSNYYNDGLIDQGVRYGSRAFQGLFLNATKLPYNFSIKGVVGKSNFNRSFLETSDNFTGCFKIQNKLKENFTIAYNYLASSADVDSISNNKRKYFIHTLEAHRKWEKIKFHFEAGLGNYSGPEENLGYGEALIFNLQANKSAKIPFNLQLYRIAPEFVNVTGNFLNTSVLEVFPNVAGVGATIRTPFRSPMVGLGFPTNNRQGGSINTDFSIGRLKINGGIGIFAEIDTSYADVSYIHNVNGQTLSRIYLFGRSWGPYNFLNSTYRNSFEDVSISDTNNYGLANFKKFFNTIELQGKYNTTIFNHDFYIFSLTRLNSCQKKMHGLPQIGSNALISQLSQEIDISYSITKNAVLVLSYGIERIIGNEFTDIGDSPDANSSSLFFEWLGLERFNTYNNARNQRNRLLGIGLDYKIGANAILFLRHNQYRYYDPNFIENHLKGSETMLELKITF
ncbi:MAG: hypothetical protein CMD01_01520 [Flavobacteriales bacterium]|nr:hypothetical protein [Flavobacteriales bacterium]